jgi:fumarylpyruvate hydrolase
MHKPLELDRRTFVKAGASAAALVAAGVGLAASSENNVESVFSLPDVSLPIVGSQQRFPARRIYCVGRNYLEHIRELGNDEREPPFFFAKHRDAIVPNGSSIAYPALTKDFQHELELVVAMKSGGHDIPAAQALSHVFGYAVGLDMTRRDLQTASRQKQQPWEIGKSFDQSAPCTAVTPAGKSGHFTKGRIWLSVNGKTRQDSDLNLMIWNVAEIIAELSKQAGVAAGDLIYTGTPAGVAAVVKGDRMVGNIDGLEELTITVA